MPAFEGIEDLRLSFASAHATACIFPFVGAHHSAGFFGKTKFVSAAGRSPYVTPTSSPDAGYEDGITKPPQMAL